MPPSVSYTVRLERQPHRFAIDRLREAYRKLNQINTLGQPEFVQEMLDEPVSSVVCPSFDASARARSDD